MGFLDRVAAYRRIVEAGSIARAAHSLGVSAPAVSRALSTLERELDAQLIVRTTRNMRVTEAGRRFFDHCLRIEREVESARESVRDEVVTGTLIVSVPVSLGLARIAPLLPSLLAENPSLRVDLRLEDRRVDLVAEGVDVAIRAGAKPRTSSSLVARQLYPAERQVVASPNYLHRRGTPRIPKDLDRHDALLLAGAASQWRFHRGKRSYLAQVTGPLRSTALLALRDAAIRGAGVALLPDWMVRDAIGRHELTCVLRDYRADAIDVFALYRVGLRGDGRLRVVLDRLNESLSDRSR